jgi:hypothetical protein
VNRAYYASNVADFLKRDKYAIFGEITANDQFAADDLQKNTWKLQIDVLKRELADFGVGYLLFEYTIPRIGNRIDNVLIYKGIVFLLEFKAGSDTYSSYALEQVTDYALDLNCFHKESNDKLIVPMLIATEAPEKCTAISFLQDDIVNPLCCNKWNIGMCIGRVAAEYARVEFPADVWIDSQYMPTPTIVEAAQALYRGHKVAEISRNDADAINLGLTTSAINNIIDYSKANNRKAICLVTGVPGSGKTLAGLNISIERQKIAEDEHAVFLSGNGPLVAVLQEALARDDADRNRTKKSEALRKSKEFIQIIHHFRDDAISVDTPPIEKVAIFDEAQRAWTEAQLSDFMKRKKGVLDFRMSEPKFLISIMDRHQDWAIIICLVGGGQEINTGEAGLSAWFDTLKSDYPDWDVYLSDQITDSEYSNRTPIPKLLEGMKYSIVKELHLAVSLRSFRSEKVSAFVKALLDVDRDTAKTLHQHFEKDYPIVMTRNLDTAKAWIRSKAKGSQRYGITASSGARRLRTYGIWVQSKIDAPTWFLNGKDDVRSSFHLEETATEFDIQGLELDWTIVSWDANLRFNGHDFEYYSFTGSKWMNVNKPENVTYLKNAYRVLLTRARQGLVIFIPEGDPNDETRLPEYYDGVYEYLRGIALEELSADALKA